MDKEKLYQKITERWGASFQMDVLVEECAELIRVLQKFNHRNGDAAAVIEELVDVEIMCEQMRTTFDPVAIDALKKQKLERFQQCL